MFRNALHFRATACRDPARNSSRTCPSVPHPSYHKGLAREERWSANRTSPLLWRSGWTDSPGWSSFKKVFNTWFCQASDLRSTSVYMVHTLVTKKKWGFVPATRNNSPKNHWCDTRSQAAPGEQLVLTSFTLTIEITSVLWITTQATLRSTPSKTRPPAKSSIP